MKKSLLVTVAMGVLAVNAGSWQLSVGPAWRSRVKSSISGSAAVVGVEPKVEVEQEVVIDGHGDWSIDEVVKVQDPDYPDDPEFELYAVKQTTVTTTTEADDWEAVLSETEVGRPLGCRGSIDYAIYESSAFSWGIGCKFAAYWKMRSVARGSAGGGRILVNRMTDYYLFRDGPIPDEDDFEYVRPEATPFLPYRASEDEAPTPIAARAIGARIDSDLYQLGLGPQARWRVAEWLEVYGRLEMLGNFAAMDYTVGESHGSDTKWLMGAGGSLGIAMEITDNLGLYAEVGYEWIETAERRSGGVKAEVDFSSLVVSAGMCWRF